MLLVKFTRGWPTCSVITELDLSYGEIMGWIRCRLSFALVRSAIMCIRGARSRLHSPIPA